MGNITNLQQEENTEKINVYNLILETTRRCNMNCRHCLRGESEDADMSMDKVIPLLERVNAISQITFTGGEPSLNVPFLEDVLTYVKENNIPVYSFYIVTNGKEINDRFLAIIMKWYTYCISCGGETEVCGISLSKDNFHEKIPYENELFLKAFSFYRDDKTQDFRKRPLIREGRAEELSYGEFKFSAPKINEEIYVENFDETDNVYDLSDALYVTCHGDILADCDLSYRDMEDYKCGNTGDMPAFFDYIRSIAEQ